MRRRNNSDSSNEPPRKKSLTLPFGPFVGMKQGEILTDVTGKKWKLGKTIGVGGFGQIYLASDNLNEDVKSDTLYVAKVEHHSNGPLFVEMNCYIRIARHDMINEWKDENNVKNLGMPHYVASGSHNWNNSKYRFLILPRYEADLESILQSKRKFNIKTVLTISTQIIDILQYIHEKGYIHSDIKASNILLEKKASTQNHLPYKPLKILRSPFRFREIHLRNFKPRKLTVKRNLRPSNNIFYLDDIPDFDILTGLSEAPPEPKLENRGQVFLLDYGLASKYVSSDGQHKEHCSDERKAHAGTILFCSRDAHEGVQSRRSDLETLGYNMIYWLTGSLPWAGDVEDPALVARRKRKCLDNIEDFLRFCFPDYPKFLYDYFVNLKKLEFDQKPKYTYFKTLFKNALKDYGYKDNGKFDFNNLEGWGEKQKKIKKKSENKLRHIVHAINRLPLQSNLPILKPKLRKKTKNKKVDSQMNWSKILVDPEVILKQRKARDRKVTEPSENNSANMVANLDIWEMNPTYAMIEVFNKSKERLNNSPMYRIESLIENVDGFTPAMVAVYGRMKERQEMEASLAAEEKMVRSRGRGVRAKASQRSRPRKTRIKQFSPKTRLSKAELSMKKESTHLGNKKGQSPRRIYSLRG